MSKPDQTDFRKNIEICRKRGQNLGWKSPYKDVPEKDASQVP
jgi:hypothetical protein